MIDLVRSLVALVELKTDGSEDLGPEVGAYNQNRLQELEQLCDILRDEGNSASRDSACSSPRRLEELTATQERLGEALTIRSDVALQRNGDAAHTGR